MFSRYLKILIILDIIFIGINSEKKATTKKGLLEQSFQIELKIIGKFFKHVLLLAR